MTELSLPKIAVLAEQCGLSLHGVSAAQLPPIHRERLQDWQAGGNAAEMRYMNRPPELLTTPQLVWPAAQSVISVAVLYDAPRRSALLAGHGRVARYAWGQDYHEVLKARLVEFAALVEEALGVSGSTRVFTDAVPLLERAFAAQGGLGFIGKNTLLIRPGRGSFFLLGEVLVSVPLEPSPSPTSAAGCGSCVRCQSGCPTGALDTAYQVDARRCISYLTIEKRGAFSVEERGMLGEWLFGCDICQEVCPHNHRTQKEGQRASLDALGAGAGVGAQLSLSALLQIRSDDEFKTRFAGSPLLRPKRAGLLRNAACVAANTQATECVSALCSALCEDSSALVRLHCAAALRSLLSALAGAERAAALQALVAAEGDPDPTVRAEVFALRY